MCLSSGSFIKTPARSLSLQITTESLISRFMSENLGQVAQWQLAETIKFSISQEEMQVKLWHRLPFYHQDEVEEEDFLIQEFWKIYILYWPNMYEDRFMNMNIYIRLPTNVLL